RPCDGTGAEARRRARHARAGARPRRKDARTPQTLRLPLRPRERLHDLLRKLPRPPRRRRRDARLAPAPLPNHHERPRSRPRPARHGRAGTDVAGYIAGPDVPTVMIVVVGARSGLSLPDSRTLSLPWSVTSTTISTAMVDCS